MAEVEKARQIKINCKSRLTKFKNFLERIVNDQNEELVDVDEIKLRLKKIEESWDEFDRCQTVMELLAPNQIHEAERTEFEDNYFKYSSLASKLINRNSPNGSSVDSLVRSAESTAQQNRIAQLEAELNIRPDSELESLRQLVARTPSSEITSHRSRFPLPKLDLPTFSGDYDEWLTFRDSFVAIIHDDDSIPNIQKLRFLRSYLKGNATRVIESLETTQDNYQVAWDLLVGRYNNNRIIIQNHTQALFELEVVGKESASGLRNLLDSALRHVRALEALKQPTKEWNTLLIYLIVTKLDKETRKEWERSVKGNEMPKFEELTNFLNTKCQMLESINTGSIDHPKSNVYSENRFYSGNKGHSSKAFINTQASNSCFICNNDHFTNSCPELLKLAVAERTQVVKRKGLCFNCLRRNHRIIECQSTNCLKCNRRHHTLLHDDSRGQLTSQEGNNTSKRNQLTNLHVADASKVLLSTATVDLVDNNGIRHACRIILDSGSQPNLITQKLANFLKLKKIKLNASVEAVNNVEVASSEWVVANLHSRFSSYSTQLSFLVLPSITGKLPAYPINKQVLKIPKHIKLSDPNFDQPGEVEALVGAEVFYELLGSSRIALSIPQTSLQSTRLGWIVTGKVNVGGHQQKLRCHLVRKHHHLEEKLEKFWVMEDFGEKQHYSKEEQSCENHFSTNVSRDAQGKYIVRLPFKRKIEELGASYETARRKFFALEKRLAKNPDLKQGYQKFMREYEDLGHMELTRSSTNEGYYMPHQAVVKESSLTTKLRVVYNASSPTTTGISLNETMMTGPIIQDGIFNQILRFRQHRIVLTADIEKMYRQFWVHSEDRKYQKILWRYDSGEPVKTYQLKTITYGTSAASFLAIRCLKQLADDEGSSFPLAARALKQDFYVDDLLTGSDSLENAKKLRDELIELTNKGGLRLCKWASNDQDSIKDLKSCAGQTNLKLDPDQSSKTLGVTWNSLEVTLNFDVQTLPDQDSITKREMLSQIAQLYDPLGLVAPVVIYAKIRMQGLWKLNVQWDDLIPDEMARDWCNFQRQLQLLNQWKISRATQIPEANEIQVHGFSNASEKAFGACIYLRSSKGQKHQSILLCAKSRVAPIKTVSLPKLELCVAVLLARLWKSVRESLKAKIDRCGFWSDSTITLNRIYSSPHQHETFVANRIAEIKNLTKKEDWRHVSTKENPADFVSRGQLPEEFLENNLWRQGPEWLAQPESHWPQRQLSKEDGPEKKGATVILSCSSKSRSELWNRFSTLKKLLHVIAYCLCITPKTRKQSYTSVSLSPSEIQKALLRVIFIVQKEEFGEELARRRSAESGGRIKNANINVDQKHPILLPKNHPFTTLVIRDAHERLFHAGQNATLYNVRLKFWPIDGRVAVRKVVNACIKCCRAKPKEGSYVMGNLPKVRVTAARPFENVGIDYCGLFFVKEKRLRNRGKVKVYAAVFVCLSIKAVHIELVGDLTAEMFIASLRRFFARRGKSKAIYSDNGTNFVGARNQLGELYEFLKSDKHNKLTKEYLTDQGIEWHFSPPRTPHFGGIWEAAVKSLKHHLTRIIGETLFTYEEHSTYLSEIEAVLNSRPLTPMSSDPKDLCALTPGHFLVGTNLDSLPTLDYSEVLTNRLSSWQHLQKLKRDFWKRWTNEYLNEMNVRSKWNRGSAESIKVGSLVVLRDENLPPLRWKLGRVIECRPGDDGIVRVVVVKTEGGIFVRGVKKISPLPIDV